MTDVFVVGAGMTPLGKHYGLSVKDLTAQAVRAALADAGCEISQIEAAWFANTRWGIFEGQHNVRGQVALRPLGIENVPIFNTDNACASSSAAFNLACAYLRAGMALGYRPRPDEVMDNTKKPFAGSRHVLALPHNRVAVSSTAKPDETIGVFLHLYYTEMTAEMIDYTNPRAARLRQTRLRRNLPRNPGINSRSGFARIAAGIWRRCLWALPTGCGK